MVYVKTFAGILIFVMSFSSCKSEHRSVEDSQNKLLFAVVENNQTLNSDSVANNQTRFYHIINNYCESCFPIVELWNVSESKAKSDGNYILEQTDNSGRVSKLLFYVNGKQRRSVVDEPDYVVFEYADSSITVTSLFALACWYPQNVMLNGDSLFAEQFTMEYSSYYKDFYKLTEGYVQIIPGKDYYVDQLLEDNIFGSKEEALSFLDTVPFLIGDLERTKLYDIETFSIPYYEYSFCKNGFGKSEPRGWNIIWK